MKLVEIYTDGACSGNPGKGGYCAILLYKGNEKIVSGYSPYTTNNKMEMIAIIEGLKALKEPCKVKLYSDSAYSLNAFKQNWIAGWIKNNWKNSKKEPVKNVDLWKKMIELMNYHDVELIKVKGHSDNYNNNRCDEIARGEITKNV